MSRHQANQQVRRPSRWLLLLLGAFGILSPLAVHAGQDSFPINPDDPTSSVPDRKERIQAPLAFGSFLMEITDRATEAFEKQDYRTAALYFEAVAAAVPKKSRGHARLCESYALLGEYDKALASCRTAVGLKGARVSDYELFARLLLKQDERLSPEQIADVDAIVAHLKTSGVDSPGMHRVQCELGVRTQDEPRLEACTQALARLAPDHAQTMTYAYALALLQHDEVRARELLVEAEGKLPPAAIAVMRDGLVAPPRKPSSTPRTFGLAVAAIFLTAFGIWVLIRSRRSSDSGAALATVSSSRSRAASPVS